MGCKPQTGAPKASTAKSAICDPMAREEVAPGEGALSTWTASFPRRMEKSSSRAPERETAWARTPEPPGARSSAWISGSSRFRSRTRYS